MPPEACIQSPIREQITYANSALFSFFKLPTSQVAGEDNSNPKLHLTINFDRVATKTSTRMVKRHGEITSIIHFTPADPCFPGPLKIVSIIGMT